MRYCSDESAAARDGPSSATVAVEHDMEFLRSFAKAVTVMHEGRKLAEGPVQAVQSDPEVVRIYLGRSEVESIA